MRWLPQWTQPVHRPIRSCRVVSPAPTSHHRISREWYAFRGRAGSTGLTWIGRIAGKGSMMDSMHAALDLSNSSPNMMVFFCCIEPSTFQWQTTNYPVTPRAAFCVLAFFLQKVCWWVLSGQLFWHYRYCTDKSTISGPHDNYCFAYILPRIAFFG